jgi:hypothetical protein
LEIQVQGEDFEQLELAHDHVQVLHIRHWIWLYRAWGFRVYLL